MPPSATGKVVRARKKTQSLSVPKLRVRGGGLEDCRWGREGRRISRRNGLQRSKGRLHSRVLSKSYTCISLIFSTSEGPISLVMFSAGSRSHDTWRADTRARKIDGGRTWQLLVKDGPSLQGRNGRAFQNGIFGPRFGGHDRVNTEIELGEAMESDTAMDSKTMPSDDARGPKWLPEHLTSRDIDNGIDWR